MKPPGESIAAPRPGLPSRPAASSRPADPTQGEKGRKERKPGAVRRHVEQLGGMAALAIRALAAAIQPPFAWRSQFVIQCIFVLKVSLIPIAISIAAWGFAGPGLQAGNFLATLGSIDRAGGFMVVAIVREFGTFTTATVIAGIAGTTITAELGARRVREELEALEVLAVEPITYLVVPRVLALVSMMVVFGLFALVLGVAGGYLASVGVLGGTTGAFLESFFANTTALDLIGSLVKMAIFGFLIGIVCCYKGLNVSGGAQGVGKAVNEAVVASLVAVFFVNLVYTQLFLAAYPEVQVLR